MYKIIFASIIAIVIASCSSSYNIQGVSNVSSLDGRMLYLKVIKDKDVVSIDSCDVLHGVFSFEGQFDTIKLASIYMDKESILPVVLEKGNIKVNISSMQQKVTGTPLNEKLTAFFDKYNQLLNQLSELVHKHDKAIMEGKNMNEVNAKLNIENQKLNEKLDEHVTSFIEENFDNVLGPGIFMMITSTEMPQLTPWIEAIISKATPNFKNDPYVKDYISTAQKIQNIRNGTEQLTQ